MIHFCRIPLTLVVLAATPLGCDSRRYGRVRTIEPGRVRVVEEGIGARGERRQSETVLELESTASSGGSGVRRI